jgi:uncharacterized protein
VEYFVYCRDDPGAGPLLEEFADAHWSFMDAYAEVMIARGPTLTADRTTHTGSMHIVNLPDAEAAHVFAFEEPYYRAGVYREVFMRRWRNELGRTMWDFRSDALDDPRFLIIGHGRPDASAAAEELQEEHRRYLIDRGYGQQLIERGPLLSGDGTEWLGVTMLVELPSRGVADALVTDDPYELEGLYTSVEIHEWQFGGRP